MTLLESHIVQCRCQKLTLDNRQDVFGNLVMNAKSFKNFCFMLRCHWWFQQFKLFYFLTDQVQADIWQTLHHLKTSKRFLSKWFSRLYFKHFHFQSMLFSPNHFLGSGPSHIISCLAALRIHSECSSFYSSVGRGGAWGIGCDKKSSSLCFNKDQNSINLSFYASLNFQIFSRQYIVAYNTTDTYSQIKINFLPIQTWFPTGWARFQYSSQFQLRQKNRRRRVHKTGIFMNNKPTQEQKN